MKKLFATLLLAAMVLSTGCGGKSETPAPPAEQKPAASTPAQPAEQKPASSAEKFSLGGISPGMSLDDAKKILGEPTSTHDNDEFIFANGLELELENGRVADIKVRQGNVPTGAGVAVGLTEQDLANAYGQPASTKNDDGKIEHTYLSGDGRIKLEFDVAGGLVTEIKCSFVD